MVVKFPDAYCCALVLREGINNQHDVAQQFMTDYKKAGYQMTKVKVSTLCLNILNKMTKYCTITE